VERYKVAEAMLTLGSDGRRCYLFSSLKLHNHELATNIADNNDEVRSKMLLFNNGKYNSQKVFLN
jgi:hypothetical protein